jgi:hypothetical protein
MCEFTELTFVCGHVLNQLLSECHFTRTDANKEHHGMKVTKQAFCQPVVCPNCEVKLKEAMEKQRQHMIAQAAEVAKHAHHIPQIEAGPAGQAGHSGQAGHPGQAGHSGQAGHPGQGGHQGGHH